MIGSRLTKFMTCPGRRLAFLPLLLFLLPDFAPAETVSSIRVEGCDRIAALSVTRTFAVQPDDELTPEMIREGIENLYATRQYRSIRVEREETPVAEVINLVILVEERPLLGSFIVEGADKINDKELLESTLLRNGLVLSERSLFREKKRMLDLYREEGYRNADVSWQIVSTDSLDRENVLFTVEEGKKVKVKRVVVLGAGQIDEGKVRKEMKTKPDNWYRSGDFKEDEFRGIISPLDEIECW